MVRVKTLTGSINLDVFNARDYGAQLDATHDDAPCIQNAIDAAYANGGGIVYIPYGTALLASRPSTGAANAAKGVILHPHSKVYIKGAGMGSTILKVADSMRTSTLSTPILHEFSIDLISDWGVSDLTFDGNAANNRLQSGWTSVWDRIGSERSKRVSIDRCEFKNIVGMHCIVLAGSEFDASYKISHVTD